MTVEGPPLGKTLRVLETLRVFYLWFLDYTSATGRVKVKVVPLPNWLATLIRPP